MGVRGKRYGGRGSEGGRKRKREVERGEKDC